MCVCVLVSNNTWWVDARDVCVYTVHCIECTCLCVCVCVYWVHVCVCVRAGHFRYVFNFFNNKNDFFAFFIKLITYFCTNPI